MAVKIKINHETCIVSSLDKLISICKEELSEEIAFIFITTQERLMDIRKSIPMFRDIMNGRSDSIYCIFDGNIRFIGIRTPYSRYIKLSDVSERKIRVTNETRGVVFAVDEKSKQMIELMNDGGFDMEIKKVDVWGCRN